MSTNKTIGRTTLNAVETTQLLKESEVVKVTGLSRGVIGTARKEGKLPFLIFGTRKGIRYKPADVNAWIESNTQAHQNS